MTGKFKDILFLCGSRIDAEGCYRILSHEGCLALCLVRLFEARLGFSSAPLYLVVIISANRMFASITVILLRNYTSLHPSVETKENCGEGI